MSDFQKEREQMVERQLVSRGITDPRVLEAFRRVPRHEFVPPDLCDQAYADHPLAIGHGQTISQPYMVALMTQALFLKAEERVLEIGTGSGYQAAILACLAAEVFSVERIHKLAVEAEERLKRVGFGNVRVKVSDGTLGWPEFKPYDVIVVTAGANQIPAPLVEQLAEGGRMVIPVGNAMIQDLKRVTKRGGNIFEESLGGCMFVPLIGKHGWK